MSQYVMHVHVEVHALSNAQGKVKVEVILETGHVTKGWAEKSIAYQCMLHYIKSGYLKNNYTCNYGIQVLVKTLTLLSLTNCFDSTSRISISPGDYKQLSTSNTE